MNVEPASEAEAMGGVTARAPVTPPYQLIGLSASLLVTGWFLTEPLYGPPYRSPAALAGVTGSLLLAWLTLRGRRFGPRPASHMLATLALCGLILASADRILIALEANGSSSGVFARAAAPVLTLQGYPAAVEGGALHVDHPEGLVTILPSTEKLGVRQLGLLWCLWLALHASLDGRRKLDLAIYGAIALLLISLVRFTLCLLAYVEHNGILEYEGGYEALALFNGPIVGATILIASGLILDGIRGRLLAGAPDWTRPELSPHSIAAAALASAAIAVPIGLAATYDPPGGVKAGRVLFDDRFCGIWEPTARMLDTEWYGDFSTYSFSSLAEYLGHWYSVDVNPTQAYTDDLLSRYDILVLKTPVLPIPESEREAIDRFVTRGGGLLLVGDHTNLLGMGSHLNSLCSKYGIRFRYDSVSDSATGGFVDYYGPLVGRSVGAIRVNHLQFMTSCSLELENGAEAIVLAPSCRRDPHDYAAPSFFGRSGPHPELAHGPTVLVASARAGRGRIAAFSDSTVWSSFALFQFDREKLAADLVGMLNREPSPYRGPLRLATLVGCLAAVMAFFTARPGSALPILLCGTMGAWCGVFAADRLHQAGYDPGPPREPLHEVAFLWKGGNCAFPPVLGNIGSLPLNRAFDTLFVSTQRLGLVPRVAYDFQGDLLTDDTRVLFVISPIDTPPDPVLARIESFVKQGGSLIVLDDEQGFGSAPAYLRRFGADLRYSGHPGAEAGTPPHAHIDGLTALPNVPDRDTFVAHGSFGEGHVVYMRGAAGFSRIGMGHCFTRPGKVGRAKYETIFWLLRDVLHINVGDRRFYGICT